MDTQAFFFRGSTVLLPPGACDSHVTREFPMELAKNFEGADIFEIPAGQDVCQNPPKITGVSILQGQPLPPGWKEITLRQALTAQGQSIGEENGSLARLLRACHISQWRRDSRFCGNCGTKNNDELEELARRCPECKRQEFPRISPAIITIVLNDNDEILLAHNKNFLPGLYSLVAGFNDPGESLEATVAREIREETNIDVRDICYVKSQPWPFPHSLMIGFAARYAGGEIRPDGIEIEDACWFNRDNLPKLPGSGSLSRYLIDRWLAKTLP